MDRKEIKVLKNKRRENNAKNVRTEVRFFGDVLGDKAIDWYLEMKKTLANDGYTVNAIMISPDELNEYYSYYRSLRCEKRYLQYIADGKDGLEFKILGFSCGYENTKDYNKAYCSSSMSWGSSFYQNTLRLSFDLKTAKIVDVNKYIEIYKKYINWNWIHMYTIDYSLGIKIKKVDGNVIQHNESKIVINDWKR